VRTVLGRAQIDPIIAAIPAERQVLARHYGVHPYFTRRPANVVRAYIERYSDPGDTVADPFGGTGVTAIEALLSGRKAIHNDLNPFANFITANIADLRLPSTVPLKQAFQRIEASCAEKLKALESSKDQEAEKLLGKLRLPTNIRLPKNSDADFFYDLFTTRQLAGLALLKEAIDAEKDRPVANLLLLAWSASAAKLNKTFLSADGRAESRGGSSIFSIYRYKLADRIIELPIWETFKGRFLNVLAAKDEVFRARDHFNQTHSAKLRIEGNKNLKVLAKDAANLTRYLKRESVDYMFTDPPYGAHIAYLDLSILWNHWLGFDVSEETRKTEIIVGGECDLSEEHYKKTLAKSIHECLDLLKPGRWFSIVFQHWDTGYFATILESASEKGAELRAAVTQDRDVIWSMHKKKNSENVLSGEMILTFYKPSKLQKTMNVRPAPQRTPKTFGLILDEVLAGVSQMSGSLTSEFLFNRVILLAWKQNCLSVLSLSREDFATHLRSRGWQYNPKTHQWSMGLVPQDELVLYESVGAYNTAAHQSAKAGNAKRGASQPARAKATLARPD
jgi:16S rRNA G966 N2-methylase RsmD